MSLVFSDSVMRVSSSNIKVETARNLFSTVPSEWFVSWFQFAHLVANSPVVQAATEISNKIIKSFDLHFIFFITRFCHTRRQTTKNVQVLPVWHLTPLRKALKSGLRITKSKSISHKFHGNYWSRQDQIVFDDLGGKWTEKGRHKQKEKYWSSTKSYVSGFKISTNEKSMLVSHEAMNVVLIVKYALGLVPTSRKVTIFISFGFWSSWNNIYWL
jgi:hypothetical protein